VGITLGIIALLLALVALAIAMGVSLGRNGDRESAAIHETELNELLGQMLDRLDALEKQHPKPDDDDTPVDASA
jgi:hypothetical protein